MGHNPEYAAYPKPSPWFDEFHMSYARNISRMVVGHTLDVGDYEQGTEEQTIEIDRVKSVVVGIDSDGIFAAINVYDTQGHGWSLYSDGTVSDEHDHTVGRHELKTLPTPTPPREVS
jgi:hypothetical protein